MSPTSAFARETPVTAKMTATGSWKADSRTAGRLRDVLQRTDIHPEEEDRDDERRDERRRLPQCSSERAPGDRQEVTDEDGPAGSGWQPRDRVHVAACRRRPERWTACARASRGIVGDRRLNPGSVRRWPVTLKNTSSRVGRRRAISWIVTSSTRPTSRRRRDGRGSIGDGEAEFVAGALDVLDVGELARVPGLGVAFEPDDDESRPTLRLRASGAPPRRSGPPR